MSQHGLSSSINICRIYLLTEHRRHQILPGLVRDGDIGFQGIILFVTGKTHNDLGRHSFLKGVNHKGSSCRVRPYHVTKGFGHNHSINSVPLHLGHLPGESQDLGDYSQAVYMDNGSPGHFRVHCSPKTDISRVYPKECTHNRV